MADKNLTDFLGAWSGQVKTLIENSSASAPKEKKVPVVEIAGTVVTPDESIYVDSDRFYTDSDGQIVVASGSVYFYKRPSDGNSYTSIYMKDLKDGETWIIDITRNGHGSFKILETDNYAGIRFNDINWYD